MKSMGIQSGHSELSVISQVSAVEGCLLSGVPLYCILLWLVTHFSISIILISADLEMAIAYWNIVLKDRFRFLDIWCQFLQVSLEIFGGCGWGGRRHKARTCNSG